MRTASAATKERIKAAQEARWAKTKPGQGLPDLHPPGGFKPEEYSALTDAQKTEAAKPLAKIPTNSSPVTVKGTWDGVRYWLNAAKAFEQGKLFSQVMVGFELLALHKAHNIHPGQPKKSIPTSCGNTGATPCGAEISGADSWEEICKQEAGISDQTGYRYMDMAKAATPRLKQLPGLKSFDPFKRSLKSLKPAMREELQSAVRKLTDGKSQGEFFEDMYKQGGRGTGRAPGCDGTKKTLTIAETAALLEQAAMERMDGIEKSLRALKADFCNVRSDTPIIAFHASLEQSLNAVKAWLKQPLTDRNPAAILALFNS